MGRPAIALPPKPRNEPVKDYAPGSPERAELQQRLRELERDRIEIPLVIGGKDVKTAETFESVMPHRKSHVLADVHSGGPAEVEQAIAAAREARHDWAHMPWEERAAVFLRAAELLAGPWRSILNAATMLGQSKTAHQAEIDAACELTDFWRFNVEFMTRIYQEQPSSSQGTWNRMEYRPLEGFVFAVTPFNFTAIAGNLPASPALMGNTIVWQAASRLSAPWNLWPQVRELLADQVPTIRMGDVADFGNFMGAVIDAKALRGHREAIEEARAAADTEIVVGGGVDDSEGYFVEPTVIETRDPRFRLMRDELFGPIVTTYVYPEGEWDRTLQLVDETAPYALTGAIFAEDRRAIEQAGEALRYTAGNFYVNDKPTGAIVGQQPFGGGRASGTNDKAGSMWNLIRWVSPRTIKETFVPPTDYRYPFLMPDDYGESVGGSA